MRTIFVALFLLGWLGRTAAMSIHDPRMSNDTLCNYLKTTITKNRQLSYDERNTVKNKINYLKKELADLDRRAKELIDLKKRTPELEAKVRELRKELGLN